MKCNDSDCNDYNNNDNDSDNDNDNRNYEECFIDEFL